MTLTPRSPLIVTAEQRRADVARMRADGATLDAIAAAHGVSRRTVQRDLDLALSDIRHERRSETERWRAELLDDLDALRERGWLALDDQPPPQAVAALLSALTRAVERTAALVGADAPLRLAAVPQIDEEFAEERLALLPPRALERVRAGMHREVDEQIDRALACRLESDARTAEQITAMQNSVTGPDA